MSRLWNDPPLRPDGSLDYARLTLAEVCEDLTETLLDLVDNGGFADLQPLLDDLPDADAVPSGVPPSAELVRLMEELLRLEGTDPCLRTPQSRATAGAAVELIRAAVGPE